MKQFIEETLHQQVEIHPYEEPLEFPLSYQGSYDFFTLLINGEGCILARPKGELRLTTLRQQQRRMEQLTQKYCVLYLKNLHAYTRNKMLEEGIPFIWENHQIYMPFVGVLLKKNEARALRPCMRISFLTQKLLLMALYDEWKDITVTMAADLLQVTKMSVTRCYDEIESLGIPVIHKKGKSRVFDGGRNRKELWEMIKPHLRNPLLQEFYLEERISTEMKRSGISALCRYSLLSEDTCVTYAITKSQLGEADLRHKRQVPRGEEAGCIIQELGYLIDYKGFGVVDPITVSLLLEKERQDPRIDKALDQMLEEYVW